MTEEDEDSEDNEETEKESGQYQALGIQSELTFPQLRHTWVKGKPQLRKTVSKKYTKRFWSNIFH